jgi:hypothetical protein
VLEPEIETSDRFIIFKKPTECRKANQRVLYLRQKVSGINKLGAICAAPVCVQLDVAELNFF